jgi:hypothetical protein
MWLLLVQSGPRKKERKKIKVVAVVVVVKESVLY